MSEESGTLETIAEQLALAVLPLKTAVADTALFRAFLQRLGWNAQDLPTQWSTLAAKISDVVVALEALRAERSIAAAITTLQRVAALYEAISAIKTAPAGIADPAAFLVDIARRLFDLLIVDYLLLAQPFAASLLQAAGVITETMHEETAGRPPYVETHFRLELLRGLISDPGSILNRVYGWGSQDINFDLLATHLHELSIAAGLDTRFGTPDPVLAAGLQASSDQTARAISSQLSIALAELNIADQPSIVGLALLELPPETGHPAGLIVQPLIPSTIGVEESLGEDWKLQLRAGSDIARTFGIVLRPDGIDVRYPLQPGTAPPSVGFGMALVHTPTAPTLLFGSPGATRLEFKDARVALDLNIVGDKVDVAVGLELNQLTLVLKASDGDSFIQKIMGDGESRIAMSLGIAWSYGSGLNFQGGAGLEATLPVNVDLAGVIKIDSVYLALEAKEDSKTKESAIRAVTATTVKVQLGPISAIVERFGLQATLSFPEKGGNLGVANLDLGFKPPNGVGLVIKAQVVTGGGYLYFDLDKEQYAGVLQLEIAEKFSLTAVGLLTTKMPDGSKGFSLLVIISVRFDPGIQLGYGFSLNGLGGLLGVNRTTNTEALRDGLRRGALGSILFPQNVVENAPQIISNLSAIFPPAKDRFLFGPMAIIGWGGSPPLLSMEIGIILELAESIRLMILGRLRVTLPGKTDESGQAGAGNTDGDGEKQDTPKIKLQLDSLGIFDFGSGDISLDAVMYDSTIGPFAITGGMALRASFGRQPMFLLSVGGFHPAFQAPAGFPSVERVALTLAKKEKGVDVRLQLSAYFALTSNTVQFGSHLDLWVHVEGFDLIGLLGFDALIQFKPFGLIASFEAMVAVKRGGTVLLSISLKVNLTGPSPWHAWGKAEFKILLWTVSKEFGIQIGREERPPLPQPMKVLDEVRKELQQPSNWTSQLPIGVSPLVTFRESTPSSDSTSPPLPKTVLLHPLASLEIRQRLVPLKAQAITRYGNATPEGDRTFTLEAGITSGVNPDLLVQELIPDWFAPAQFYVMSDAEKLSAPSFEQMNAGIRLRTKEGYLCGKKIYWVKIPVASKEGVASREEAVSPLDPATWLTRAAPLGAAGQAPLRHSGPAKYRDPARLNTGITLQPAAYRVVGDAQESGPEQSPAAQRMAAPSPSAKPASRTTAEETESALSYSAACARARRARQGARNKRAWVVPDIGMRRD